MMLDSAVRYALDGLAVFPCARKKPLTGEGGFRNASVDAPQILEWWTKHPDAQIGLPTGEVNALFVVDVDGPVGARAVEEMNLPPTFEVETRPGRRQLWFKQQEGVKSKCSVGVLGAQVDTRGDGGFVIAPPSIHHLTGQPYRILKNRPWAIAPDFLLNPTKSSNGTKPREVSGAIPQGQRHSTLLSLAGSLAKRGLPEEVIRV